MVCLYSVPHFLIAVPQREFSVRSVIGPPPRELEASTRIWRHQTPPPPPPSPGLGNGYRQAGRVHNPHVPAPSLPLHPIKKKKHIQKKAKKKQNIQNVYMCHRQKLVLVLIIGLSSVFML